MTDSAFLDAKQIYSSPNRIPSKRGERIPATFVRCYAAFSQQPEPASGTTTPGPAVTDHHEHDSKKSSKSPYYFLAGYSLFAKRAPRPFPPPFLSVPSSSFSDALSTHDRARDKRNKEEWYHGEIVRGVTNGDDAALVSDRLIAASDGVGAWAQKERGHAALWSRLILHFWAAEAERNGYEASETTTLSAYLQRAFELTKQATSEPNEWFGTTTATGAMLQSLPEADPKLFVTQLGDSAVLVIRPHLQGEEGEEGEVIYRTKEQWHWFDCPRQLGTNSPDSPDRNAVTDTVEVKEGDIVLAMSDGVSDNLWEHEVVTNIVDSLKKMGEKQDAKGMQTMAAELVKAARAVAQDPFAECPFMERAIEEGLPTEGGK
ncbi:MAG: hypothetical protein M1828_004254 [Chrysothrix sp. TS-e1954]|nr:MAG: hypothetical protein M1828_004254 [Chrysothrix sp. TS-e1954]